MANASESQKNKLNQELLKAVMTLDEKKAASCLKKGADPDVRNKTGDTLLNIVLSNEQISPKLIELLVESGAHLNYVSSDRVTPLMCAVYNMNVPLETVAYLLQAGASIYSRDTYGQTPLLYATGREDVALVDLLVTYGSSVNETDADGNTLLFEAVRQGYENLFSYLVDQGADLTVRDYQGATLLMAAVEQKQEKMALFLLDFSEIDVLASRVDGLTALDMVHDALDDGSLTDDESKASWQSLADALTSRVSDRLSFFDELNEADSDDDFDELDDEENTEDFVEIKEGIGDGFDDFDLEEETVLLSEEDEDEALEEDEELPYGMDSEEDIIEEDEDESVDEDDDFVFALESDEEELADESWEEEELPYSMDSEEEIVEEEELPYSMDSEEEIVEEEELPYSMDSEEEIVEEEELPYSMDSEEELPYMLGAEDEGLGVDEELSRMLSADDESAEEEDDVVFVLEGDEEALDDEDDVVFVLEGDEEALDDEDDVVFVLEGDEEALDDEDDVVFVLEGDEEALDDESMTMDSTEGREYNPYDTKNMDPLTYFETEKSRVVSHLTTVNGPEISAPLNADQIQSADLPKNNLPLYSHAAYQHAEKMIKKYTEYQSEEGQKGVCLSGVYLTSKACSQARVHIERSLLSEGYSPQQAHEQSVVILYKLIRANGLYHPKEFVFLENGQKSLAFKIWGCDHRLLLKSLTSEFAPEGDWCHSLHEIEKYVGEKGEGKLLSAM